MIVIHNYLYPVTIVNHNFTRTIQHNYIQHLSPQKQNLLEIYSIPSLSLPTCHCTHSRTGPVGDRSKARLPISTDRLTSIRGKYGMEVTIGHTYNQLPAISRRKRTPPYRRKHLTSHVRWRRWPQRTQNVYISYVQEAIVTLYGQVGRQSVQQVVAKKPQRPSFHV